MGTFTDIIPSPLADCVPEAKKKNYLEKLDGGMTSTVMVDIDESIKDSLEQLKAKMASRNIKLGGVIGVGDMGGVVYEILGKDNKPLPSAILRIDGVDTVPIPDKPTPGLLRPLLREGTEVTDPEDKNKKIPGYFAMTIVPRAKDKTFTTEEYAKTLAAFNSDGLLPQMTDLAHRQFMEVPGMDIPVITDLGCYRTKAGEMSGIGSVEMFSGELGIPFDKVMNTKLPAAEMDKLRAAQEKLHERCLAEVKAAGIDIDDVPTRQSNAKLTAAEPEVRRGKA